mgnify:CR=1 FL=1
MLLKQSPRCAASARMQTQRISPPVVSQEKSQYRLHTDTQTHVKERPTEARLVHRRTRRGYRFVVEPEIIDFNYYYYIAVTPSSLAKSFPLAQVLRFVPNLQQTAALL